MPNNSLETCEINEYYSDKLLNLFGMKKMNMKVIRNTAMAALSAINEINKSTILTLKMPQLLIFALALFLCTLLPSATLANGSNNSANSASSAGVAVGVIAENVRSQLAQAALDVGFEPQEAASLVKRATESYQQLPIELQSNEITNLLEQAKAAAKTADEKALVVASASAWSQILALAYEQLEKSIEQGNAQQAQMWLAVREYRLASPLSRLNADATLALEQLQGGEITPTQALKATRSDLLDGYQARFNQALRTMQSAKQKGFRVIAAEQQALAKGYFGILRGAYLQQFGSQKLAQVEQQLQNLPSSLAALQQQLADFKAAPLSEKELARRTSQVLRFLSLVPVEYGRGVKNDAGKAIVTQQVEINEARAFQEAAAMAWSDIAPLLPQQQQASQITSQFNALSSHLSNEHIATKPLLPQEIRQRTDQLLAELTAAVPAEWQKSDASADLDVVRSQLAAVVSAASAAEWQAAEAARIDAYSLLESGTEARIAVFNPELKLELEGLIWHGSSPKGLATLIKERAPASEFKSTKSALDKALAEVGKILGTEVAPAAVSTNAGIIVFREGLEAVLILAALMGSLRKGALIKLRRPMWLGAAAAGVATVITWLIMQQTLSLLGKYGEKLEAVVSLIAIAVLLLIMNWFFHQVYWTDRMAAFQQHKHDLTHSPQALRAQWWGLAVLGFTSIYREGFETALFLQSLVLQSGLTWVLTGTAVGLAAVLGVGLLVFWWQAKLPMKKLLIWTGLLICAVLGVMVGNTVHTLQLVGWLTVHPLPIQLPASLGLWFGLHATWEGVILQLGSVVAVVGSFFAAESLKERQRHQTHHKHLA